MPDGEDANATRHTGAGTNRGSAFTFSEVERAYSRLESLTLAPKSKVHIRGVLNALWNYAMWKQDIPMQVNPITLVKVKGASKRVRQPLRASRLSNSVCLCPT